LDVPFGVNRLSVESADQMLATVAEALDAESVFVSCAAVADYKPLSAAKEKMKKSGDEGLNVELTQNPDILKWAAQESGAFCVGFAAETQHVSDYAKSKMERKGITMICANDVSRCDIGFSCDDNELQVFYRQGNNIEEKVIGPTSKALVAEELIQLIDQVRQS
jgi:phosphopantothenoylcysteine decarboxylase/phosphopantothenate--cysteine ligase